MDLKSRYILLNNVKYYYSDLQDRLYISENKSPFEVVTLKFCTEWLNGKENYTLHTSGSTDAPKLIKISAQQMKISAQITLKALNLRENDIALICLNTQYIAGIMMLVRGFEGGMQMIIKEPSSNPILEIDKNIKIDFTALVPLQLQNSLENQKSKDTIRKISNIIIGGAPISLNLEESIQDFENNIYHSYGMTETVSHVALRRLTGKQRSDFYTVLDGVEIDTDSRGCLKIKGVVTRNKWLTTNDIVTLLGKNKFQWRGRFDQVIISGGIKFQIEELERKIQLIFQNLNIRRRFLLAGRPHELWGEEIMLLIEGEISNDILFKLQSSFKNNLDKYEIPKTINFILSFKETPTGKILRKETLMLLNNNP